MILGWTCNMHNTLSGVLERQHEGQPIHQTSNQSRDSLSATLLVCLPDCNIVNLSIYQSGTLGNYCSHDDVYGLWGVNMLIGVTHLVPGIHVVLSCEWGSPICDTKHWRWILVYTYLKYFKHLSNGKWIIVILFAQVTFYISFTNGASILSIIFDGIYQCIIQYANFKWLPYIPSSLHQYNCK